MKKAMINCIWVVECKSKQESDSWVISGTDMYRTKKYAMEMAQNERDWDRRYSKELKFRVRKYTPESSD